MLDYLHNIKGPDFLLYFYIYGAIVLVLGWILTKIDNTSSMSIPDPSNFSYLELAYIRCGIKAVISVVLYEMWNKSHIEMNTKRKAIAFNRKEDVVADNRNELQKFIWDYLDDFKLYKNIVSDNSERFTEKLNLQIAKVKRAKIVTDEEMVLKNKNIAILTVILVLLPGIVKMLMGIQNDKPVFFLVLELLFFVILSWILFGKNKPHQTKMGKKLLTKAKQRYDWLKTKKDITSDEELIGVAIFGIAAFNMTNKGLFLPDTFDKNPSPWIWFGGCSGCGCSGGYSDGGGGCSSGCGSSCSGGCGGGCGGCGGD
nr:TIGR04222 domain-containing membrane protein [uncultured Carboxylicivirga sp.]